MKTDLVKTLNKQQYTYLNAFLNTQGKNQKIVKDFESNTKKILRDNSHIPLRTIKANSTYRE